MNLLVLRVLWPVLSGLVPLFFASSPLYAQSATFQGTVLDSDGEPVENVYVILEGNRYHGITGKGGEFQISGIKTGKYDVTVSRIGYKTFSGSVDIPENATLEKHVVLEQENYRSETVVVTATRGRRDIEEVPEPITVIKRDEIKRLGSTRLNDILAEQTGLLLTSDHGTGVQVQGFDADYTLIMLNGRPLIGRTAGTLDLSRVSLGNVQQVEIMKGPSSALWGSDAMAGVINIITAEGNRPFEMAVNSRYGTHQTLDAGTTISWNRNGWQNDFFANHNSSGGYRLIPSSVSQTMPGYQSYTGSWRTELPIGNRISLELASRYFIENQQNTDYLGTPEQPDLLDTETSQQDYSLSPALRFRVNNKFRIDVEHFLSGYRSERILTIQNNGSLYEEEIFDQAYNKLEARGTLFWNEFHTTTAGSGVNRDKLKSDRYAGNPIFRNLFIYGQHEWRPGDRLDIIAGFRFDAHNAYASQLSPKFSARYKLNDKLHVRGSAGRGFKAPEFRQLFLNFINPTAGYSVFGSGTVVEKINQLQDEGKIERLLLPLDQLDEIRAERSWAYNFGIDIYPLPTLQIRVNLFRNNVNDLIEAAPIALKTNGQAAYTYFNLDKIYTQGGEFELRWNPFENMDLSVGYQLLDARRHLNETRTVQDENGNPIRKEMTSYEPMFNRSMHSVNAKLFYLFEHWDLEANIRGQWRGRYGQTDANGNGFVNENEYENGYILWNFAVAKHFADRFTVQFGIDNLFDFKRPAGLSHLGGRLFYTQVSLQLF